MGFVFDDSDDMDNAGEREAMVMEYGHAETEHIRNRVATVWKSQQDSHGDGEVHGGCGRLDEDTRTAVKRSEQTL